MGGFAEVDAVLVITFVNTVVKKVAKKTGLSETDLGPHQDLDM